MVSKRMEKVLRECAKEDGVPIPEEERIEDWLRRYFISSPLFVECLQEWVDRHKIHSLKEADG